MVSELAKYTAKLERKKERNKERYREDEEYREYVKAWSRYVRNPKKYSKPKSIQTKPKPLGKTQIIHDIIKRNNSGEILTDEELQIYEEYKKKRREYHKQWRNSKNEVKEIAIIKEQRATEKIAL